MTRGIQRCFHGLGSSLETLIQSGFTERITYSYILNAGGVITLNVLGNYLLNYMCSSRNSAEITGIALDRNDFRLFLSADNDFCVSFHFLSSAAYRLVITLNHGYVGFSKVDGNSNFVAREGKKKIRSFSLGGTYI